MWILRPINLHLSGLSDSMTHMGTGFKLGKLRTISLTLLSWFHMKQWQYKIEKTEIVIRMQWMIKCIFCLALCTPQQEHAGNHLSVCWPTSDSSAQSAESSFHMLRQTCLIHWGFIRLFSYPHLVYPVTSKPLLGVWPLSHASSYMEPQLRVECQVKPKGGWTTQR